MSSPMNGDAMTPFILNIDNSRIACVNINHWPWEALIYSQHGLCDTQPCEIGVLELQEDQQNGRI